MSWRIVVVSRRAKLDLKLESMVVRGEETLKIYLGEIAMLIVESTAVSLTAALLCELVKRKINVVFCDEQRNPLFELLSYYGSHDTAAKIRNQIAWDREWKDAVWTEIVRNKIMQQRGLLGFLGKAQEKLLTQYIGELQSADTTNREGHAAKVYFNALFGMEFTRGEDTAYNAALNYGYSILLSAVNREIVANGYITQLGIHHDSIFNKYNLGSDLMEPFRPLVDAMVIHMRPKEFGKEEKMMMVNILNQTVLIDGQRRYVNDAIKVYCKSVLDALSERDLEHIRFYKNEFSVYESIGFV